MGVPRINRSQAGILVIDVQPFFVDWALPDGDPRREALLVRLEHLLMLADWLELPTVATFEKPTEENGELPDRLEAVFPAGVGRYVKNYFGACSEPGFRTLIEPLDVRQWIVAGAETDVCVLQTTLRLLQEGYEVFLLEDCLFTTEPNPGPALRRMYKAGAVPGTLKTATYELLECVDALPWYPERSPGFPASFVAPEEWPPWDSSL